IVTAAIDYGIYSKKEHYIAANSRKKVYNDDIDIPESFFSFRNKIDYGNEFLRSYYPYYRFLSFHLDNLAFAKYQQKELYNPDGFTHNFLKNKLIDSLITNETLKNRLLRTNAHRYFVNAKDEKKEQVLLEQFREFSSNATDKDEIERLAEATIRLTPGHTIPNLALLTTENTVKDLHSIFNKPTVIYFWSNKSIKHYKKIHTRANELRDKYPEYDFIGINLDTHFKKWLKVIKASGYREAAEFQFENFDDAEMKLVINSVNKAMVVDKDGKILDGNTNIFDISIESELLAYLNR
ncbi:MAG: thioredoxin family protein, partial [Bacteroidetes bacterium]|nr:thioredoxin family protein [Bacteroidota bacterium]